MPNNQSTCPISIRSIVEFLLYNYKWIMEISVSVSYFFIYLMEGFPMPRETKKRQISMIYRRPRNQRAKKLTHSQKFLIESLH